MGLVMPVRAHFAQLALILQEVSHRARPAQQTLALLLAPPRSLPILATTSTAADRSSPARLHPAAQLPP